MVTTPYRSTVNTFLERRASRLDYWLSVAKSPLAVKNNEPDILSLLKDTGFSRAHHRHNPCRSTFEFCDNYFLRGASLVVMRFKLYYSECIESSLHVIPAGERALEEVREEQVVFEYYQKFDALVQQALGTDSLLYIARNTK